MTDLGVIDLAYKHDHEAKLKVFAIDIETYTQGKRANEYTDNKEHKLGNVKDKAKVEAALQKKREEARRTHALHWFTGKIISVAIVDVFGDEASECIAGHDEAEILKELSEKLKRPCKIIGKSSEMFDFGFIRGRYMYHQLEIPAVFKQQHNQYDVDKFFAWSAQSSQRGSLADYAHGLGIEAKTMKGSDVHDLYTRIMMTESVDKVEAAKLWEQLIEYNIHDSEIVAEITRRYAGEGRRL